MQPNDPHRLPFPPPGSGGGPYQPGMPPYPGAPQSWPPNHAQPRRGPHPALIFAIIILGALLIGLGTAWALGWFSRAPAPSPLPPAPVASAPATPPQPVQPVTRPVTPPQQATGAEARTWRGAYTCGQGRTGVEVTMRPLGQGRLQGTFAFYPMQDNPTVPSGCFNITAQADRATQSIRTRAGSWVRQPPGYSTVDLEGRMDANGNWRGRVVGAAGNCTTFDLIPAPAPQASCGAGGALPAQ